MTEFARAAFKQLETIGGKLYLKNKELIPTLGIVEISIDGKTKKFVSDKLVSFLENNGKVRKKAVLKPLVPVKVKKRSKPKEIIKKGTRGHNRRKEVVCTKDGVSQEFKSITEAAIKLKICRSKMFSVLNGRLKTLKGYEIKYKN